jgi:hypothetical protein
VLEHATPVEEEEEEEAAAKAAGEGDEEGEAAPGRFFDQKMFL